MSRIAAFTLVEVLVSLFLVALLGTFAVAALGDSAQDLRGFDGVSAKRLNVLWFCEQVRVDLDRSTTVTLADEGGITMQLPNALVRYHVDGDSVVRSLPTGRTAFLIAPLTSTVEQVPSAPGLVQAWNIQLAPADASGPLVFRKEHDARTIIRYLIDHADTP